MSADFPSSNPFRRKQNASTLPSSSQENPSSFSNHIAYQAADPLSPISNLPRIDSSKKAAKKVRVQSPPPSSPSNPDSASTIGEDTYSGAGIPPQVVPHDDGSDGTSHDGETYAVDNGEVNKPLQAPANPFSRTLETIEHSGQAEMPATVVTTPGRASLDVEAFKRLLMTGSAGLSTSTTASAVQVHPAHHGLGDGGSSTDASSLSRQSIFEAIQEPHPESPRTSHEISEPEDERRWATKDSASSTSGRKKPPPPSSRHGKLIKVELKDDPPTTGLSSPTTLGSFLPQNYQSSSPRESIISQTDLNKPLPAPPNRTSNDLDPESVFDKEAAGKIPEPPSPSASIRRKTPPAPPLARRHSQRIADSSVSRSESKRLSPNLEEEDSKETATEIGRSRSDSLRAPPPPPSRRPGSIRIPSHSSASNPFPSPNPPPPRGSARSISGRPPSVSSMEMSSFASQRASTLPPPPPPPRHPRNSMDGTAPSPTTSRRGSVEQSRRSVEEARGNSSASSLHSPGLERVQTGRSASGGMDILADLSALQREIDALRSQSEKEKIT